MKVETRYNLKVTLYNIQVTGWAEGQSVSYMCHVCWEDEGVPYTLFLFSYVFVCAWLKFLFLNIQLLKCWNSTCRVGRWGVIVDATAVGDGWRRRWRGCCDDIWFLLCRLGSILLNQTFNLKGFSNLKQGCKLVLGNVNFPSVHVFKDCLNLCILDILQNHNRMAAR